MAMRKYKKPAKASEPGTATAEVPAPEPSPVAAESPTAAPADDVSTLRDQLATVRFASKPLEDQINELGDLSVGQRAYIRARPHAVHFMPLLAEADKFALQNGIQRDTPQYFTMLDYVLHHGANSAFGAVQQAPMQQAPEPAVTTETKMDDEPADTVDDVSIYSAPPSRGEYATTGGSHVESQSPGRITLNAAQREAAKASGVDELVYARNLLKMGQMKKAGLIKD